MNRKPPAMITEEPGIRVHIAPALHQYVVIALSDEQEPLSDRSTLFI